MIRCNLLLHFLWSNREGPPPASGSTNPDKSIHTLFAALAAVLALAARACLRPDEHDYANG